MAYRPNSILMNSSQTVVPSQSPVLNGQTKISTATTKISPRLKTNEERPDFFYISVEFLFYAFNYNLVDMDGVDLSSDLQG